MTVCKKIHYFRGIGVAVGGEGEAEEMETETTTDMANKRACFSLMKKFTKEVLYKCSGGTCTVCMCVWMDHCFIHAHISLFM